MTFHIQAALLSLVAFPRQEKESKYFFKAFANGVIECFTETTTTNQPSTCLRSTDNIVKLMTIT